jgi:thioredoxin reductase (NADPH)
VASTEAPATARPVILLVDDEPAVLEALARDLDARFGRDCRILAETSATVVLAALAELAERGEPVAAVLADQHMPEMAGVELLGRAHRLHPRAQRVLVVERDYSSTSPVVAALTLGQIDNHLTKPWLVRRGLYLTMAEILADWARSQDPLVTVFRIVGEESAPRSHELRDLLSRQGLTYAFHPADSEVGRQVRAEAPAGRSRLPLVVRYDGRTLSDPSNAEVIEALGANTRLDGRGRYDVAIVGSGPAGLAAAVYAASEGLRTVVLEREVSGGQAGFSFLIRNYPGFPHGIGGDQLAFRACEQAWLFGAELVFAQEVCGLRVDGPERVLWVADGREVRARTVVIAAGVSWRRLGVPSLDAHVGCGVFYGAGGSEVHAMEGGEVLIVGAANSAGQAALHLARYAARVTLLVRGDSLTRSMADYLVREIGAAPNIVVRLGVEAVAGHGSGHLEAVTVRDRTSGATETVPATGLFVLIGGEPHTAWLEGVVERDDRGFVLTGRDVTGDGGRLLLETSVPGVFAAGDVRHRSVKRVASAVGEGAVAVQLVHEYLADRGGVGR